MFLKKKNIYRTFQYEPRHKKDLSIPEKGNNEAPKRIKLSKVRNSSAGKFSIIITWFIFAGALAALVFWIFRLMFT